MNTNMETILSDQGPKTKGLVVVNQGWVNRGLRRLAGAILGGSMLVLAVADAQAGVPEPDTIVFGSVSIDGKFVKATDSNVVVQVRSSESGPIISSYRMGASPRAGDRYVVRVPTEDLAPVLDTNSIVLGSRLFLTVLDSTGVRDAASLVISNRAQFVQLDFGDVDTDGDGMSDRFEQQYFGSATGGNPNADPDGDGRPNRREALQGTNPLRADGRHPADVAVADDALTIKEVTDYALAWQTGTAWSIEPTNIPIAYVTRAGALWKGGEKYLFDNDPVTNAPNWWVNLVVPPAAPRLAENASEAPLPAMVNKAFAEAPLRYSNGVPFQVRTKVEPVDGVKVYAVEDRIPDGWLVRNVSGGGRFDRVNRKIKWGPFFDSAPRNLTYQLIPTQESASAATLSGTASFDGADVAIGGSRWMAAVDPSARLVLSLVEGDEGVKLTLTGVGGATYRIESSTDLAQWSSYKTVTAGGGGVVSWSDASTGGAKYFRAVPDVGGERRVDASACPIKFVNSMPANPC